MIPFQASNKSFWILLPKKLEGRNMNELKENRWSFKSTSSIDKKLEDSNSTSRTASLNLATTEEEAKSKFVRTRLVQGLRKVWWGG